MIGPDGILKILKVLMYKIGLTYKRSEIFFEDVRTEFKKEVNFTLGSLRKDLELVNEGIS